MTTTLVATYATLADALRTRHELLDLQIETDAIGVAVRRGMSVASDARGAELSTLGWLVSDSMRTSSDGNLVQALVRAGVPGSIVQHLAFDVERGCVLIGARVQPKKREAAELVMSQFARYPDLVGYVQESLMTPEERDANIKTRSLTHRTEPAWRI